MNTLPSLQLLTEDLIWYESILVVDNIKGLIFVLKSSTECDIDFMYRKNTSDLNFCFRLEIYVLMV